MGYVRKGLYGSSGRDRIAGFAKADECFKTIINMGRYELLNDYADLYRYDNPNTKSHCLSCNLIMYILIVIIGSLIVVLVHVTLGLVRDALSLVTIF